MKRLFLIGIAGAVLISTSVYAQNQVQLRQQIRDRIVQKLKGQIQQKALKQGRTLTQEQQQKIIGLLKNNIMNRQGNSRIGKGAGMQNVLVKRMILRIIRNRIGGRGIGIR